LQYVNRDGGWWQSQGAVAGSSVRLDVQEDVNVPESRLDATAGLYQWIRDNEPSVRSFVAQELSAGRFTSNLVEHPTGGVGLETPRVLEAIRPYLIVLSGDHAELRYEGDALADGQMFGADCIEVTIGSDRTPESVFLRDSGRDGRAHRILDRPLPADAADFENSVPDQFVARAAYWGWFSFSDELRGLLQQAILRVDELMRTGSPDRASYMGTVKRLLLDIAKDADEEAEQ
jgi:hypothetical protein